MSASGRVATPERIAASATAGATRGDQARIEGQRDQVLGAEADLAPAVGGGDDVRLLRAGELRERADAGELHLLVDLRGAHVQRAAEDEGEAEDVVDLVRVVAAAGGDDAVGPHRLGVFRPDLRVRVGQRQDQGPLGHALHHLGLQHAGGREAEEDVGAWRDVAQGARLGRAGVARLLVVHVLGTALVHDALAVGDEDVLLARAEPNDQVEAGDGRRARARADDPHVLDALAHHLQSVEQRGAGDDGGAVLVVVENRDLHAPAQRLLDHEALRRLDVLEVDAAEGRLQAGDDLHQLGGSVSSTSMSKTSMPANFLNRQPLPSITGLPASAPMLPSPSTAVPLLITATRLLRDV